MHVTLHSYCRRPSGSDKEFFIQLFVGPDENIPMPDTHWLLHKMFKEDKITFEEVVLMMIVVCVSMCLSVYEFVCHVSDAIWHKFAG